MSFQTELNILSEKQRVKDEIAAVDKNRTGWFEPVIRFAKSLQGATLVAATGTDEEKRDFLKKIGSNLKITDRHPPAEPRGAWKAVVDQGRFAHPTPRTNYARRIALVNPTSL